MNSARLFGVYTAQFPFLDVREDKIRPVIVVGKPQGQHRIIAVVPVSSKADYEQVDIALINWATEGLVKPSIARVHRLTTMLQEDLIAELGSLDVTDRRNLQVAMRQLLNL